MQLSFAPVMAALILSQTPNTQYRTANFVVQAETLEVAKIVAESAESTRKRLGKLWLDQELENWSTPCQIRACINLGAVAGITDVTYAAGRVRKHEVDVQGPLDRVLKGPLPHELTHVLFAHYFGAQAPRWADEGGAILSEDESQGERQTKAMRKLQAEKRYFPLRRLLEMRQYPQDMPAIYAQGHSLTRFLVDTKDRKAFLAFVKDGIDNSWDEAVVAKYGFKNVEQLEKNWVDWIAKRGRVAQAAANQEKQANELLTGSLSVFGAARMAWMPFISY